MAASIWDSTSYPKKRLERLVDLVAFLATYYFLFINQGVLGLDVPFRSPENLLALPIVAGVIIPLIHYLLVLPDPLQRSDSSAKAVKFFQSEFPSLYLLQRCEQCVESSSTCPAYLLEEEGDFKMIWFKKLFQGELREQYPEWVTSTFAKGYTCRLVFYVQRIMAVFAVSSLVLLVFASVSAFIRTGDWAISATALQVASLLGAVLVLGLVHYLNRPDHVHPTGCWQAWREINRMSVAWMRDDQPRLNAAVCRRKGNAKVFQRA